MADETKVPTGEVGDSTTPPAPSATPAANVPEGFTQVPTADLAKIHEQLAAAEIRDAEREAQFAGLQAMVEAGKGGSADGEVLRKRKTYEPKFRTVRIRKYPMAGDTNNLGFVVGWTDRGAYQKIDTSGISKQIVDYIDIIYLGHERSAEGKLQAESVPLLDLLNRGVQVHCKILDVKKQTIEVPTGEEIDVTTWDPAHGLVATGDKVDGFVAHSEIEYTIDVPGFGATKIDGEFVN